MLKKATDGAKYRYYHYLQGADLPIKTQDEIHNYFDNQNLEFITFYQNYDALALYKIRYYHLLTNLPSFRTNYFIKGVNHSLCRIQKLFKIDRTHGIQSFHGSALFSITDKLARYLVENQENITKRYRFTLAADEVFLQNIVMSSQFKNHITNFENLNLNNARLIDRERTHARNSPHVWVSDEFEYIINQPRGICFARKFDYSTDRDIIIKIFNHISQKEVEEN